jgi:DinB superfamily
MNSSQPRGAPDSSEYSSFFGNYIPLVTEIDAVAAMQGQLEQFLALLRSVPESVGNMRHAPYTWSIKEVVGHIIDTERVFAYRAMRIARADATPLPGFDQDAYVSAANFDRLPLASLVGEFAALRRSNVLLFSNLPADAWLRRGEASKIPLSVRALAYAIVGHARHHQKILETRLAKPQKG